MIHDHVTFHTWAIHVGFSTHHLKKKWSKLTSPQMKGEDKQCLKRPSYRMYLICISKYILCTYNMTMYTYIYVYIHIWYNIHIMAYHLFDIYRTTILIVVCNIRCSKCGLRLNWVLVRPWRQINADVSLAMEPWFYGDVKSTQGRHTWKN